MKKEFGEKCPCYNADLIIKLKERPHKDMTGYNVGEEYLEIEENKDGK